MFARCVTAFAPVCSFGCFPCFFLVTDELIEYLEHQLPRPGSVYPDHGQLSPSRPELDNYNPLDTRTYSQFQFSFLTRQVNTIPRHVERRKIANEGKKEKMVVIISF